MPNGNPFFVPTPDYSQAFQTAIGAVEKYQQRSEKEQDRQRKMQQEHQQYMDISNAIKTGDLTDWANVMAKYPDAQGRIKNIMGLIDEGDEKNFVKSGYNMLNNPTRENIMSTLQRRKEFEQSVGKDTSLTDQFIQSYDEDPKEFIQYLEGTMASIDTRGYPSWLDSKRGPQKKPLQKGAGALVFDPDEGYRIDPVAEKYLAEKAEKKAATAKLEGVQLKASERRGINADVTNLLKDTTKIADSAKSLADLNKFKSPAAKLAAVFKFMKALDPTSVVRETEQGQVYSAQGPAASIAGKINQMLGQGQLTDASFIDLVNTSYTMANSAIDSSGSAVSKYLDTYEDTIPVSFKEKALNRIPSKFSASPTADGGDRDIFTRVPTEEERARREQTGTPPAPQYTEQQRQAVFSKYGL